MLNNNWLTKTSKIRLTFKNGSTYELEGDNKLINVSDDRAICNIDGSSLLGVRSNNIWITINDSNEHFIKNNIASPLYGLLDQGFKIEYFINVDNTGYVKTGEYFGTDVPNSSSSRRNNIIEIQGNGQLQYIGNFPVNILGVKRNIAVKQYLEYIFNSVGLTSDKYIIDDTLNRNIKYAYIYGDKLADVLNDIAIGNMCCIYEDEDGKIRVLDLLKLATKTTKDFVFDGNINTSETIFGTSLLKNWNSVRLNYSNPTDLKNDKLLDIKNIDIPVGTNVFSDFKYNDNKRALSIDFVTVKANEADVDLTYSSISATQSSIVLSVTNNNDDTVTGNIYVNGNSINDNPAVLERYISGIDINKRKYFEFSSRFIQSDSYAVESCNNILRFISADNNYVTIFPRSNPMLRLGSIVNSISNKLNYNGTCIVARIKRNIGAVISFEITVIDTNALLG